MRGNSFLCILVSAAFLLPALTCDAATRYDTDGEMPVDAEIHRWFINRARFAPEAEADDLSLVNSSPDGSPDYDVCEDTDGDQDFGTTVGEWAPWTNSRPPLATHYALIASASNHSSDMASMGYPAGWGHDTRTNTHYTVGWQVWNRATNEGYVYIKIGENISIGMAAGWRSYPANGLLPYDSYTNLFVDEGVESRGHRMNHLDTVFREMGAGVARSYSQDGDWWWTYDWHTENFGARNNEHFFTGTIFYDSNADKAYTASEGIGGITIRLFDGAVEGTWYDVSTASGNFTIPIKNFTDGRTITVKIINDGTPRSITIPSGYDTQQNYSLSADETVTVGTFVQPAGVQNVGFRELDPAPASHTIVASAGANGSVSPSGTNDFTEGTNQTFTFSADDYYHVDDVLVDGGSVGSPSDYTFTNVTAAHTVTVSFAENLVTNDTPEPWLASYGLTNFESDAIDDQDGDGLLAWQEYMAGTDPTNPLSVFAITAQAQTGSQFTVTWYGTTNSGVTNLFGVYRATNLTNNSWTQIASNLSRHATGTNAWNDLSAPSNGPVFYRIIVQP